jgi:hypothetical protein
VEHEVTRGCETVFALEFSRGAVRAHLPARKVEQSHHIETSGDGHEITIHVQKKRVTFALGKSEGLLRCALVAANLYLVSLAEKNVFRVHTYDGDVGTLGGKNAHMLHLEALINL